MDQKILPKPIDLDPSASAWRSVLTETNSEQSYPSARLDLIADAWLGRVTGNISPAAIANAYFDWLTHLQLSPSKQEKLMEKAWQKWLRWNVYAFDAAHVAGRNFRGVDAKQSIAPARCIHPLPQDKRFADPAWERWPFNVISQGFLLYQQWWHRATVGTRGVSQHHEDVVTFTVRQFLDMLAPSNFILTNPAVQEAIRRTGGANLLRGVQTLISDQARASVGNHAQAAEGFKVGVDLAVTPGNVVFENRLIELIQYAPVTKTAYTTPLLFIPAWIMKYYILDLSPGNSLIEYLVAQGYTVFMISWKNPVDEDRDLSMQEYRNLGAMAAIDAVCRITGAPQINAVGYCLGGTLLSIAAASMARDGDLRLASLTMFASQVDFEEPGELSLFIDESQISFLEAIMWHQGFLDNRQMAGAFQLLRSNDLIWSHRVNQYLLGKPEPQSDLMAWNADATRMPYRMHSEYLRQFFLHNDLAEGRYRTNGKAIGLGDIHVPIFSVGTITDHIAPWRSVYKIHQLADAEVTFLLTSGGHNAGVVSPPGHPHRSYQVAVHPQGSAYIDADTWQKATPLHNGSWWPEWTSWLATHSGKKAALPHMGAALRDAPGLYVLQA